MFMNKDIMRIWACATIMEQKDRLRFFTLTVPESDLPLRVVADRWRDFVGTRWWRRLKRKGDYIVVYEPHPSGHGWHIHVITNFFIPWQELSLMARVVHFGHTDIEAVDSGCALYCAKYLSKAKVLKRLLGAKNVRIVNVSRGLVRLKDIEVHSPSIDFIRSNWIHGSGLPFMRRYHVLYLCWISATMQICGLHPIADSYLSRFDGFKGF